MLIRSHGIYIALKAIKKETDPRIASITIRLVDRGRALNWRIVPVVFVVVIDYLCRWYFLASVVGVFKSTTLVMSTTGSELRGSLD